MVRNSAFVFIKPHALTDKVKELVKETFEKKGVSVKNEGELGAEDIDKKMLVDKHYYSIASKATILTPDKLNVPKDKFKDKFGVEWDEVLKDGKALNAKDACEKFEIDAAALDTMWGEAKKDDRLVKLGGGFYCAKLEPKDKGTWYVFNGFFMSMRSKFVQEGAAIYYYIVQWETSACTWEDFRGKVLGPTDPAKAPEDSLRGAILKNWKELELKFEPNVGDNGVHASASPFEGLAERMNWLGYRVERDPFGKLLLKAGITPKTVREWSKDPQVTYGPIAMTTSLFDKLEDTDSDWCLCLCQMMAGVATPKPSVDYEAEIAKLKTEIESYKPLEKAVLAMQKYEAKPSGQSEKGTASSGRGRKGAQAPPPPESVSKPKKGKAAPEPEPKAKSKSRARGR